VGRVKYLVLGLGLVSHLWFKISPKNPKFSIFALWVKKISLGRVKKYPGHISLLFTAGQKYARVGSGSGPISNQD